MPDAHPGHTCSLVIGDSVGVGLLSRLLRRVACLLLWLQLLGCQQRGQHSVAGGVHQQLPKRVLLHPAASTIPDWQPAQSNLQHSGLLRLRSGSCNPVSCMSITSAAAWLTWLVLHTAHLRQSLVDALDGSLCTVPSSHSCGAPPLGREAGVEPGWLVTSAGGGVAGTGVLGCEMGRTCKHTPWLSLHACGLELQHAATVRHLSGHQLALAAEGEVELHSIARRDELGQIHLLSQAQVQPLLAHDQVAGVHEDIDRAASHAAGHTQSGMWPH